MATTRTFTLAIINNTILAVIFIWVLYAGFLDINSPYYLSDDDQLGISILVVVMAIDLFAFLAIIRLRIVSILINVFLIAIGFFFLILQIQFNLLLSVPLMMILILDFVNTIMAFIELEQENKLLPRVSRSRR